MIEFAAKYYDGITSHARDVVVRVDDANRLSVMGLAEPVTCELAEVSISPRLGNTTRSLGLPNGAKCETEHQIAIEALERRAGKGRLGARLHALESSWRATLVAAALLVALIVCATKWGIPMLSERVANAIPRALAYDLGRGTLAVLDRTMFKPSALPAARAAALNAAFSKMAKAYPALPLTLAFRRGPGPNAFALPDGTVVVTDELVELAKEDQEVLAVVAHEIGHVHHRHTLRMALESSTVVLLASAYFGDVTQLTTMSAVLPGVYAEAHYSRAHETQADTFALDYLHASGIPPKHFANILRALRRASGPDPEYGLQYLSSHPPTPERIRRFEH